MPLPAPRPLSNSISRNQAVPNAPAYGNTTNVNGSQTASAMANSAMFGGNDAQAKINAMQAFNGVRPAAPSAAAPAAPYAGGDAPGIAQYYRQSALQQYFPGGDDQTKVNAMNAFMQNKGIMPQNKIPAALEGSAYSAGSQIGAALSGMNHFAPVPGMIANQNNMSIFPANQGLIDARMRFQNMTDAYRAANQPAAVAPQTADQTLQQVQRTNAQRLSAIENARLQNTQGFASQMDPNRLRPEQRESLARVNAEFAQGGGPASDPTNLSGRMAGFNSGPGWYDRYAQQQQQSERDSRALAASALPTLEQGRAAAAARHAQDPAWSSKVQARKDQAASALQSYADSHEGLSRRHVKRLESTRRQLERNVQAGRITRDEMDARMDFKAKEMIAGRSKSALPQPGDQKLNQPPQRGRLTQQSPQQAQQAIGSLVNHNEFIKHHGWTPETTPDQFIAGIATLDPSKMTPDQKFNAARAYHDFALSQVETGNEAWKPKSGDEDPLSPNVLLNGLDTMKPGNREGMIRWFEDFVQRSRRSAGAANADIFGNPTEPFVDPDFTMRMPAGF